MVRDEEAWIAAGSVEEMRLESMRTCNVGAKGDGRSRTETSAPGKSARGT